MRTLKANDYKLFEQLVSMRQPTLLKTMNTWLRQHYKRVVATKEYVFAVGDIPVALVAHLDTVFAQPAREVYYDERKNVIWSPQGLGADDRAGVYAILKIIRAGYKPHIIFTTDEEIGGGGAEALIKQYPEPFAEMKYVIELDRKGTNDCVFYDCDNVDFVEYIESFGFCEAIGTFSDISIICPKWGIAGVNLSIGYQNEHSYSETFHINPFLSVVDKVINLLKDANNTKKYIYIPSKYAYGCWNKYNFTNQWYQNDDYVNCARCKNTFTEYELFPVKGQDGKTKFYCPDCIVTGISWCSYCAEGFETDPNDPDSNMCPDCKKQHQEKGDSECTTSEK